MHERPPDSPYWANPFSFGVVGAGKLGSAEIIAPHPGAFVVPQTFGVLTDRGGDDVDDWSVDEFEIGGHEQLVKQLSLSLLRLMFAQTFDGYPALVLGSFKQGDPLRFTVVNHLDVPRQLFLLFHFVERPA